MATEAADYPAAQGEFEVNPPEGDYPKDEGPEEGETQPTQLATQQYTDPRRLGQGTSGLADVDLADIICILHPASPPAYKATALIHQTTPQYTLNSKGNSNIKMRQKNASSQLHEKDKVAIEELESQGLHSCDIVLRLSATVKNPATGGFLFGRNSSRCDIVLGKEDQVKRVSNIHFRIFLNEYGIIMLEDRSTNGTCVDTTLLRAKNKENGKSMHTLSIGSIISLTMSAPDDDFKFIVSIPLREFDEQEQYNENLNNYYTRLAALERERDRRLVAEANARKNANEQPPKLFGGPDAPSNRLYNQSKIVNEWRGGDKYNKVGIIGKGAFAVVYKMTSKFDGVPFAAKEIEKRRFMKNGIIDQKLENEMKIMQAIKHPHIVQYIEAVDYNQYLFIIMEFIPHGDLGGLVGRNGPLAELEVKTLTTQLLGALKYLHDQKITHRDVKPDNILINTFDPFEVKLTDFGLSKVASDETFNRTFCGTLLYCAPEVYNEYREYDLDGVRTMRGVDRKALPPHRYDSAVDIWSLAGVLFYTLTGMPPYPAKNGITYQELLHAIMTTALDVRPLQLANVSEQGIRFIKSMLNIRPQYRATTSQLEADSWLTGAPPSFSVSMEGEEEDDLDEVDMVETNDSSELLDEVEHEASQLSLLDQKYQRAGRESIEGNTSDMTELLHPPMRSYDTNDALSSDESFGYITGVPINPPGNGRLFGEVGVSHIGSSGAIPSAYLPRPAVERMPPSLQINHGSGDSDTLHNPPQIVAHPTLQNNGNQFSTPRTTQAPIIPAPGKTVKHRDIERREERSSSLMGAESMVGHLNMHSPAGVSPPGFNAPSEETTDLGISLRRPREEYETSFPPSDIPPKKRFMSSRQIDIDLPTKVFWDPKDKSTHHTNYPPMSASEFHAYEEQATLHGETFAPGKRIFESTMRSFRASRSPSFEPTEVASRSNSDPTIKVEPQRVMIRDERMLHSDTAKVDSQQIIQDRIMPPTAHGSPMKLADTPAAVLQPVVGNDFQPPKRILAKLVATQDSVLPTITLNVTEVVTSWGRGTVNTLRYSNGKETRVPKYAFKILLFKSGFTPTITPGNGTGKQDMDLKFYISTKAARGIQINGMQLKSCDAQNPNTPAKFWGELRSGDLVTVWHDSSVSPTQHCSFLFECLWGGSNAQRDKGEPVFEILSEQKAEEIEKFCMSWEGTGVSTMNERKKKTVVEGDQEEGGVPLTQVTSALQNTGRRG